jgi:hypothetical protein
LLCARRCSRRFVDSRKNLLAFGSLLIPEGRLFWADMARMVESLSALEQQADQEEIRLRKMNSVTEIGDHLLAKEAALGCFT